MNLYVYVREIRWCGGDPLGRLRPCRQARATWASDSEFISVCTIPMEGEAVLHRHLSEGWREPLVARISRRAVVSLQGTFCSSNGPSRTGRAAGSICQDFRNQLAPRMLDPQATESEHVQRQINEARAQAAEDLQPFIDALRTGGEIGIGLVPGGGLAVFLGTPSLMNAAAMLPLGGAAAKVVGGAARGVRGAEGLYLRASRAGPRLSGKIPHQGELRAFSTQSLSELRDSVQMSLRTREREIRQLGDIGGHGRRIGQERRLLESINDLLRDRGVPGG
ncbi:MAG: hypothetical protein KF817_14965 [Phycisphaeraceae bacterium]|nr:hypothetical protein [Phycisphaeraceae bacterium]